MRFRTLTFLVVVQSVSSVSAATKYAKADGLTSGNCDSWASACNLDRAITVASSGDSIWAMKTAGGSPYGRIELKNGVKIIGGFAEGATQVSQSNPTTNLTVIDGGGTQQCVFSDANGSSTVLRGFTISNGHIGNDWDGGGGLVLSGSDAIFVDCIFENNTATRFGAGVSIRGTGTPRFFNCIFRNNGSGTAGSDDDDEVEPIAGGAVYLHSGSPSFVNCLFYGNKAAEGAAIANVGGTPTFTNCTIANNYAKFGYGGALHDDRSRAVLKNCILWGNTASKGASQILHTATTATTATYSNVQGGWPGTGNMNFDPLFVNLSGGSFALQNTSPCRNVGDGTMPDDLGDLDWDNITAEPVMKDLAGAGRVQFTGIDLGAYENGYSGEGGLD